MSYIPFLYLEGVYTCLMFNVLPTWNKVSFANFTKLLWFCAYNDLPNFKNWAASQAQKHGHIFIFIFTPVININQIELTGSVGALPLSLTSVFPTNFHLAL